MEGATKGAEAAVIVVIITAVTVAVIVVVVVVVVAVVAIAVTIDAAVSSALLLVDCCMCPPQSLCPCRPVTSRWGSSPSIWRERINRQKMFPPLQNQPFN